MLRHAAFLALGLGVTAQNFTAECNDGGTITVTVPFDREAEVLELNYGTCTQNSSSGVRGLTQNQDFSFEITLELAACNMDSTLRAIELVQQADLRIGRSSVEIGTGAIHELSFATFDLDTYCSVTDTYEVVFDYGNLTVQSTKFEDSAGEVNLTFAIKAYDETFSNETTDHSTTAGQLIYLGITVESVFNHDEREFAPETCTIHDTINSFQYTMFHNTVDGGCSNPDIELVLGYSTEANMWEMTHVLFLLGDFDESTFLLKCTMKVCTISDDSECDAIRRQCSLPELESPEMATLGIFFDSAEVASNFNSTDDLTAPVTEALVETFATFGGGNQVQVVDATYTDDGSVVAGTYNLVIDAGSRKRRSIEDAVAMFMYPEASAAFFEALLSKIAQKLMFSEENVWIEASSSSGSSSGEVEEPEEPEMPGLSDDLFCQINVPVVGMEMMMGMCLDNNGTYSWNTGVRHGHFCQFMVMMGGGQNECAMFESCNWSGETCERKPGYSADMFCMGAVPVMGIENMQGMCVESNGMYLYNAAFPAGSFCPFLHMSMPGAEYCLSFDDCEWSEEACIGIVEEVDGPTELYTFVNTPDDAFSWKIIDESPKSGLGGIWNAHIELTSQKYLDHTLVDMQKGNNTDWVHNVLICVGQANENSSFYDAGMLFLRPDRTDEAKWGPVNNETGGFQITDEEFDTFCGRAAALGYVAVVIDQVPPPMVFPFTEQPFDKDAAENAFHHAFEGYMKHGYPIEGLLEFAMAKVITSAMNMVDEVLDTYNYRSANITKWGLAGESKRAWACLMNAAVEERVVTVFPALNPIAHAVKETFLDTLTSFGGFSFAFYPWMAAGIIEFLLIPSAELQKWERNMDLNNYKERLAGLPTHFVLGSADVFMPFDGLSLWWDDGWAAPQKYTQNVVANLPHEANLLDDSGAMTPDNLIFYNAWNINFEATILGEEDQVPYVESEIIDETRLDFCIKNYPPSDDVGVVSIWYGNATDRDFRSLSFDLAAQMGGGNPYVPHGQYINKAGGCYLYLNEGYRSVSRCTFENDDFTIEYNSDSMMFELTNAMPGAGSEYVVFWVQFDVPTAYGGDKDIFQVSTMPHITPFEKPFPQYVCPGEFCSAQYLIPK